MTCALFAIMVAAQKLGNLHDLAYGRGDFEARLKPEDGLYVMGMNSNGYNMACYPIGVATRRYVIDYGAGNTLTFQAMRNGKPRTVWSLPLEDLRRPAPKIGTLRRLLARDNLQIKSRKLTRAQRTALDANVNFVDYSIGAQTDILRVAFVRKDGTEAPADKYDPGPQTLNPPFFPIPPEESQILGFGAKRWYGTRKFQISRS
jgi:hypothetical protein